MEKNYVPKTLEECFEWFDTNVPDIDLVKTETEKSFVAMSHFGIGMWIRNNWGLWSSETELSFWFISLGIKHADDMSAIIITSYWRHKNNQPLDLESQIKKYKDWWDKNGDQFPKEEKGVG